MRASEGEGAMQLRYRDKDRPIAATVTRRALLGARMLADQKTKHL